MQINIKEKVFNVTAGKEDHPVLWFLFCTILVVISCGMAGLALLAVKLPAERC